MTTSQEPKYFVREWIPGLLPEQQGPLVGAFLTYAEAKAKADELHAQGRKVYQCSK